MHVKHINAARHAKRCTFLSKMYTTENCIEQFSLSIIGESACGLPSFGLGVFYQTGRKGGKFSTGMYCMVDKLCILYAAG